MSYTFNNTDDQIDVRDIIERFEELEAELQGEVADGHTWEGTDEKQEFDALQSILTELAGNGGDEQWRGDWYPIGLVRDSYFEDYARELLEDCGDIPKNLPNYIEIDWEATARNIRIDYSSIEIDGVTYWYR